MVEKACTQLITPASRNKTTKMKISFATVQLYTQKKVGNKRGESTYKIIFVTAYVTPKPERINHLYGCIHACKPNGCSILISMAIINDKIQTYKKQYLSAISKG